MRMVLFFFAVLLQTVMVFCSDISKSSISGDKKKSEEAACRVQCAWDQLVHTADDFDVSSETLQEDIQVLRESLQEYEQITDTKVSETVPNICPKTREIFKMLESQKNIVKK